MKEASLRAYHPLCRANRKKKKGKKGENALLSRSRRVSGVGSGAAWGTQWARNNRTIALAAAPKGIFLAFNVPHLTQGGEEGREWGWDAKCQPGGWNQIPNPYGILPPLAAFWGLIPQAAKPRNSRISLFLPIPAVTLAMGQMALSKPEYTDLCLIALNYSNTITDLMKKKKGRKKK